MHVASQNFLYWKMQVMCMTVRKTELMVNSLRAKMAILFFLPAFCVHISKLIPFMSTCTTHSKPWCKTLFISGDSSWRSITGRVSVIIQQMAQSPELKNKRRGRAECNLQHDGGIRRSLWVGGHVGMNWSTARCKGFLLCGDIKEKWLLWISWSVILQMGTSKPL